nr:hypothetical protein ctg_00082 [Ostreid herpesvirus 1]
MFCIWRKMYINSLSRLIFIQQLNSSKETTKTTQNKPRDFFKNGYT